MAVESQSKPTGAAGRRWFFGANVSLVILLAAGITAAVNYAGQREKAHYRRDVAGGFAAHRISERTKKICEQVRKDSPDAKIRISTVYASEEVGMDRKDYFPRLRDLCEEIRQFDRAIEVEHLHSPEQRLALRERVQGKFGTASEAYNQVIAQAKTIWSDFDQAVSPARQEIVGLIENDKWVSGFSPLATIANNLDKHLKAIEETRREVDDLIHAEGIPQFGEANTKIKALNDAITQDLENAQEDFKQWNGLVELLSNPDAAFATQTKDAAIGLIAQVARLRQIIGDPKDESVPDDPKKVIQDFTKAAQQLAADMMDEYDRVNGFVKANPALAQHPLWQVRVQQGIFATRESLPWLLGSTAGSLSGTTQRLRQVLAGDQPEDILQNFVRQLRGMAADQLGNVNLWAANVNKVLEDGARIDPESRAFIARGSQGELFKSVLDPLGELETKIGDLPELDLDEIARGLQQENIVVIENDGKVEVVSFDDVWPYADPTAPQFGDDNERRRVFDGDSAISGGLLSTQAETPFGTVILVSYETRPANPMMGGGGTSPIPPSRLTVLRDKLEQANFKIKEWNLGGEGEAAAKPEPEEGTKPIYVLLPPGRTQQNPFMRQQQPPKNFGPPELQKINDALADGGRALFLTFWQFVPSNPNPFMPAPTYEYKEMLEKDWGINVEFSHRVIHGLVNAEQTGTERRYNVSIDQWVYMQLSNFTDQPIGKPLESRRMLMSDVCPVIRAESVPDGVEITPVLEVPEYAKGYWAEPDVLRIIKALQSGERDGTFTQGPNAWKPPFSVIAAAENSGADRKIVVMGNGLSLHDPHVMRRVMRMDEQGRLITDPPPTENVDLFINAVYWLSDREDLIAAGPADMPIVGPIDRVGQRTVRVLSFGWAALFLVTGVVVWFVRRK